MPACPSPKQSLLLWRMLIAESEEDRSPLQSKTNPKLTPQERSELVAAGYIVVQKQKRGGSRLELTDKAWAWAGREQNVQLLQSNSKVGAIALEGLLRRLVPFLNRRGIPLAELLGDSAGAPIAQGNLRASVERDRLVPLESVVTTIEKSCRDLATKSDNGSVRLTKLRRHLPEILRESQDIALNRLHHAGKIALYRDDNTAAVSLEDTQAALVVGGEPRHILYWRG